jgi:hypothetical protein
MLNWSGHGASHYTNSDSRSRLSQAQATMTCFAQNLNGVAKGLYILPHLNKSSVCRLAMSIQRRSSLSILL